MNNLFCLITDEHPVRFDHWRTVYFYHRRTNTTCSLWSLTSYLSGWSQTNNLFVGQRWTTCLIQSTTNNMFVLITDEQPVWFDHRRTTCLVWSPMNSLFHRWTVCSLRSPTNSLFALTTEEQPVCFDHRRTACLLLSLKNSLFALITDEQPVWFDQCTKNLFVDQRPTTCFCLVWSPTNNLSGLINEDHPAWFDHQNQLVWFYPWRISFLLINDRLKRTVPSRMHEI